MSLKFLNDAGIRCTRMTAERVNTPLQAVFALTNQGVSLAPHFAPHELVQNATLNSTTQAGRLDRTPYPTVVAIAERCEELAAFADARPERQADTA